MAPRRTLSKRKSSMVKSTPKKTILQKHGKKLAALAALLGTAAVGYNHRKYLKRANEEAMLDVFFGIRK
jgi:hypothetical protein